MTTESQVPGVAEPRLTERLSALVDILYLSQVTWLYVFSLLYPAMGLFYGILFLTGSISEKSKKVGRICLILGIMNTALVLIAVVTLGVLGATGVLAGLGQD